MADDFYRRMQDDRKRLYLAAKRRGECHVWAQEGRLRVIAPQDTGFHIAATQILGGTWRHRTGCYTFPLGKRPEVLDYARRIYDKVIERRPFA